MYDHQSYISIINRILTREADIAGADNSFYIRFLANASNISFTL